jgi:hypothetical protein
MIAYFTTAVFDQLYRKSGCTSADIAALRKAIYGRDLTVRLSPHNLEEILLERKVAPQALSAQLRQALSFASLRTLMKPCQHLLIGDVRDYAAHGSAGNPFLHGPMQDDISNGIAELIESDGEEFSDEFRAVLEETRRQKIKIAALGEHLRTTVASRIEAMPSEERVPTKLWEEFSMPLAAEIAGLAGVLEPCRTRGFDGLLETRTVRIAIALILADFAGGQSKRRGELHHALGAAAAGGVWVWGSGEGRENLAPLAAAGLLPDGFEAIGLGELLGRLGTP